MGRLGILILFFLISTACGAQTIVDPHTFPLEADPQESNFEFYSRATGTNKRASFNNVRKRMLPTVQLVAVGYTPAPSGNSSNKGDVVEDPNGGLWYIDGLGNARMLNAPWKNLPEYDNDEDARLDCLPVNGWYRVSETNTLGLPPGTVRQRIYGGLEPC